MYASTRNQLSVAMVSVSHDHWNKVINWTVAVNAIIRLLINLFNLLHLLVLLYIRIFLQFPSYCAWLSFETMQSSARKIRETIQKALTVPNKRIPLILSSEG